MYVLKTVTIGLSGKAGIAFWALGIINSRHILKCILNG